MPHTKATPPLESPAEHDPVERLIEAITADGFTAPADEDLAEVGERLYRRDENVLFAKGETVFMFIEHPRLDEKTLRQAMDSLTNLFRGRTRREKALSVFQPTTVYVCFIARSDSPHTESLGRFVESTGGAVLIPVIIVPEINQVVYPTLDEKVGSVTPRIQYLQYLLGERLDPIDMHRQTARTFYTSIAIGAVVVLALLLTSLLA